MGRLRITGIAVIVALTVLLTVVVCFSVSALMLGENGMLRLEAENENVAVLARGEAYVARSAVVSDKSSPRRSSGNEYVTGLTAAGGEMSWVVSADAPVTVDLCFAVANSAKDAPAFELSAETFVAAVNGRDFAPAPATVAKGSAFGDDWTEARVRSVPFTAGQNRIVLRFGAEAPPLSLDYLEIDAGSAPVYAHFHDYDKKVIAATCENESAIDCYCADCGSRYLMRLGDPTGHVYGAYHYSDETNSMVCYCKYCGRRGEEQSAPESEYFGEVFEKEEMTDVFPRLRRHTMFFEAENAEVDVSGGLSYGDSHIEKRADSHGGAHVANISNLGNSVTFGLLAADDVKADLVLVLANVRYGDNGIEPLDPMSKFVSVVVDNGRRSEVDFTYVSFPGDRNYDYYNWRYVVIRNVDLNAGVNSVVISPRNNDAAVTIPNIDVLYVYTDAEDAVLPANVPEIKGARVDNGYAAAYMKPFTFDGSAYSVLSASAAVRDVVIDLAVREVGASEVLSASFNGSGVDFGGVALAAGNNRIVIPQAAIDYENTLILNYPSGLTVTAVYACGDTVLSDPYVAELDTAYDYFANMNAENAKVPVFSFEAEDADLGNSRPYQNSLITENAGASGGKDLENMAVTGNSLVWRFASGGRYTADLAIRLACTNYDSAVGGNTTMTDLSRFIRITVDGKLVDLSDIDLECSDPDNWFDWTTIVIRGLEFDAGEHAVSMVYKNYNFPNTDVMYIFTEGDASFTAL